MKKLILSLFFLSAFTLRGSAQLQGLEVVKVPEAPRITLIIRKFYKKHPEKYPLFTFPGVFCLFFCRNSRLTFYF